MKTNGFYLQEETQNNDIVKAIKRAEKLRKEITKYREEVQELTLKAQQIEMAHKELHAEYEKINQFINDELLEKAFDKCSPTELPKVFTIKNDTIFCDTFDFLEKATKEAEEAKQSWLDHIARRKEKQQK